MRIVLASPFDAERRALLQLLIDDGHEVSAVATHDEAVELVSASSPHVLIADAQVMGIDGAALTAALLVRDLRPRVILLCPRVHRSREADGVICLSKPVELAQLRRYLAHEGRVENRVA